MITRTPRSAAFEAYSATPRGSRWAESTRSSLEIPRSFSSSTAGSMPSRSDSEPMRMPTSGPASSNSSRAAKGTSCRWGSPCDMDRFRCDVRAELRAWEVDLLDGGIGLLARVQNGVSRADHVEDAPAGRDELTVAQRRARVKDERAGCGGHLDAPDRDAALWFVRVTGRGQDDGHGRERLGVELDSGQLAVRGRGKRFEEVAPQAGQERLRLGGAEAAVELEHARSRVGQHQAGVEEARERRAAPRELGDHRTVDEAHKLLDVVLAEHRHGRVAPHPTRVRALVSVLQPLEVLGGSEREDFVAVRECEERHLLALEQLLDDDVPAERARAHERRIRLLLRAADEDALARREAVGLDDAGCVGFVESRGGRDRGRLQHLFGEGLRPFNARGRLARPEYGHARAPELVRDACDKRRLGADDDEVDLVLAAEAEQALDVVHADRVAAAERRDPRISRRRMQLRQPLALRDLPRERVLAAARPQDQHLHEGEFKVAGGCFKYRRRAVGEFVWSNLDLIGTLGSPSGSSSNHSSWTPPSRRWATSTTSSGGCWWRPAIPWTLPIPWTTRESIPRCLAPIGRRTRFG